MTYSINVCGKYGAFRGADFRDYDKARDYYAEMLVAYPNCRVDFYEQDDDADNESE